MKPYGTECKNADKRHLQGKDRTIEQRGSIYYEILCIVMSVVRRCRGEYTNYETRDYIFVLTKCVVGSRGNQIQINDTKEVRLMGMVAV